MRGLLLLAWCLVAWGSVLLLAIAWAALTRGGSAAVDAFARLSPVNQALGVVALLAWGLVAWGLLDARARRYAPSASSSKL